MAGAQFPLSVERTPTGSRSRPGVAFSAASIALRRKLRPLQSEQAEADYRRSLYRCHKGWRHDSVAQEHGATFVIAGIMPDILTSEMLMYARNEGMLTVDIAVDMTRREHILSELDRHPTPLANQKYAQKLGQFFNDIGLEKNDR